MRVLVVNAGSSSLKLALLDGGDEVLATHTLELRDGEIDAARLHSALESGLSSADAVGHRIVHGGPRYQQAIPVDREVEASLREFVNLAPLHQRTALDVLNTVHELLPELPSVACFDTAFHATMKSAASTYPVPSQWREQWGLRRYGFHGLSHAWIARRVAQMLERNDLRIVSCHLGAGASLCAIQNGQSQDTTMGFTPLEGLAMATRSGSIDPGVVLWLLEEKKLSAAEIADTLEHKSGLLGLAGTADMQVVIERAQADDANAQLALDVYLHRLRSAIAAMSATLGGIDVLVFTGGVGENSVRLRACATTGLEFLGVALDDAANYKATGDRDISSTQASAHTLVLGAREDLEIARQVRSALESTAALAAAIN